MKPYIDVRGAYPIYICGYVAVLLDGCPRSISIELAITYMENAIKNKG